MPNEDIDPVTDPDNTPAPFVVDVGDESAPATQADLKDHLDAEVASIEQDAVIDSFPVIDTAALKSHFEGAQSVVGINVLRLVAFYDKCREQYRRSQ